MPRPKRPRYIESQPGTEGFSHDGIEHSGDTILSIEEFEAIRLSDYLGLDQSKASEQMNVSRQTFGRILKQARYNLSEALVTGKRLRVTGGCYEMHGRHRRRGGKTTITEEETMIEEQRNRESDKSDTPADNDKSLGNKKETGQGQGQGRGSGQGQGRGSGQGQGRGSGQGQGRGSGQGQGRGSGQGQGRGSGQGQGGEGCRQGNPSQGTNK